MPDRGAAGIHQRATRVQIAAAVTLAVAAAPAMWWLVGDLTPNQLPPDRYDYMLRTPEFVENAANRLGVISLTLGLVAAVALTLGSVSRELLTATLLLVAAGLLLGVAGRVATAGVTGANIGGPGLVLLAVAAAAALSIAGARLMRRAA